MLVSSLLDVLSQRRSALTFVAFVDLQKAFDTAWVEGTLVRLHEVGVTGQMWHLMSHFLRDTQSQVRVGASLSAPWQDSGIAQGRVLSPLLFNLLINSLASDVRQLAPGIRLLSHHRFSDQLHADDLVVVADCKHDLQVSCDVVAAWARKWRFKFGVGPTKSAAMVFGPTRLVLICAVTLAGVPLPQVSEYPSLDVTLTSSLIWVPHIRKLIARSNRLFAQCVSWCRSEHAELFWRGSWLLCSGSASMVHSVCCTSTGSGAP